MVHCDECGDDVLEVWRRRERTESMTHRRVRWICRECNPDVQRPVERVAAGKRSVTDGGSRQPSA